MCEQAVQGLDRHAPCPPGPPTAWHTRRSIERRRIKHPALVPRLVVAAIELQCRSAAEIARIDLAIVADLLDDLVGPRLAYPELLADTRHDAEELLHSRVIVGFARIDIRRRNTQL